MLKSVTFLLMGVVFILTALGVMSGLIAVGALTPSSSSELLTTLLIVAGWAYAILLLITGLLALLTGGASLIESVKLK